MAKEQKANSLADFGPPKDFEITLLEIKEILDIFKRKFGGYGPKGKNIFYDKAGIAKVSWETKQAGGKEPVSEPNGRLIAVYSYPEMNDTVGWRKYRHFSEYPYEFWEHIFGQVDRYLGKVEYAKKMELKDLMKIADDTARQVRVLPEGDTA